jgi:hypothetical protein
MTWDDIGKQQGYSPQDITTFKQWGYTPDQFAQALSAGLSLGGMADAAQKGISPWQYLTNAGVDNPAVGNTQPETVALAQMRQIDPTSEALRTGLGQSYLTSLNESGGPTAAKLQSYLDLYKQVDPTSAAGLSTLGTDYASYLKRAQDQAALGAALDPSTQREVSQAARQAQIARGNVYGTPQLVAETMQRGSAGEARQQQRTANLANALSGYQGYLTSGATPGGTALNLYQQSLANQQTARANALSYLGSGQTPYAAGSGYLNAAQSAAASAAQSPSYQYNPQALGLGASFNNPAAGNQAAQTADQYYNSMLNAYSMTPQSKNKGAAALGGAISGGIAGIPLAGPTYGGSIVAGAALGGLGGYMS